jgi:hypothetical protein
MQNRSTGGMELKVSRRSGGGEPAFTSSVDVKQLLYFLLLVPGVAVSLLPLGVYPPRDARIPVGAIVCAFLISAVLRLSSLVQRQPGKDFGRRRTISTWAGLALPLIAILLFLNGRLDSSPRRVVRATVIGKTAPIGTREAQYGIRVTSWRPGRRSEDLNVGSRVFARAVLGKGVTVELHKGFLGLPWYDHISPD